MRVVGKKTLFKVKRKNIGNRGLCEAIDELINDLESYNPKKAELKDVRKDADSVHQDGFYFFDIQIYRTLILIELDDEGEATVIWAGSHQEYERTFKNNKSTIVKWLRAKNYID
jgi:hypothetical protein